MEAANNGPHGSRLPTVRNQANFKTARDAKLIPITLTPDELWQAVCVAAQRRISCLFGRKTPQHYDDKNGGEWSTEIESCCAEIAAAKWMGVYWAGGIFDGKRAETDLGEKRQVRHTVYKSGALIIYPEDNPKHKFLLVTGKAPNYQIVGWLYGQEAVSVGKTHPWWTAPANKKAPSWWVPQENLRPINPR